MSSSSSSVPSTMNSTVAAPKKVAKKSAPAPATSVPAPVAAPTPVPEVKKAAAPKKATSAAPSPAASVPAPVAAPVVPETVEVTFEAELAAVQTQLTAIREAASAALAALKRVSKRHSVEVKDARKNRRKARQTSEDGSEPRRPNNFEIPVAISDELSAFFGGGKSATMSRTQVNKRMSEYVKSHNLGEGQTIHPDAALRKLLRTQDGDKVTIFNIQKYLKVHYPQTKA